MNSHLIAPHIKQKLEQIVNIPTLPQVLAKVIPMLSDPKVSAREIARVISQDQSLVSRVLRIVNSAFYGFPRQITTIDHALVILGFNRLKAAIFTASVLEIFRDGKNAIGFDVQGFWEHSIGVGVVAKSLAKYLRLPNVEEHFIFGLLHDVGKLILDYYGKEYYKKVIKLRADKDIPLIKAEEEELGFNHGVVGALVLDRWNLPPDVIDVVGWHHSVLNYEGRFLQNVAVVSVADALTRLVGIGNGGDPYVPDLSQNLISLLRLDLASIDFVLSESIDQIESMKEFLEVIRGE